MNVVPYRSKISPNNNFATGGDFALVNQLLRKGPLYEIPEHARGKMIASALKVIDNPEASNYDIDQARKFLLECDKHNLNCVKAVIPRRVEHVNVENLSDNELEAIIIEAAENICK